MFKRFFSIVVISPDNRKPVKKIKIGWLFLLFFIPVLAVALFFTGQVYYQVLFNSNKFTMEELEKKSKNQNKVIENFYEKNLNNYIELEYIKLTQDKMINASLPNNKDSKRLSEKEDLIYLAKNQGIITYIDEVFLNKSSDKNYTNLIEYFKSSLTPNRSTPSGLPVKGFVLNDFEIPNNQNTPIDKQSLRGILIGTNVNESVKATADGIVVDIAVSDRFGDVVEIFNGMGFTTRYYGIRDIIVKQGDMVKKGDIFAKVAGSADFNIAYFYYQIINYGIPQNPLLYN